jgi:transcriptional regulator GlxA family with amidase domain
MAFRRRRSTFRGSTGSLGWIRWNRSGKDGTLGLGRCLRPLPGFRILGRVALETLLDCLVEKHVSGRAAEAATSDDNRIGKGSRPLFTPSSALWNLHEHLDASVSVFQLARLVDLSSSQFARMFKASTGVSPHRYQLNTRIGKAQELLLMKGESLSMVALATGFADQSHFTRTFKRVIGVTPHEWHQNRIP